MEGKGGVYGIRTRSKNVIYYKNRNFFKKKKLQENLYQLGDIRDNR